MLFSPAHMHIPDGFLSVPVALALWLVTVIGIGIALKRLSADLGERQVPLMGVLAAAIFAGQMLNFAVAGGTSGHLMGAALATILLGPWAATVVLTCVVAIQALIFQDGGLLALGANIFNMGIVGVAVAYMAYRTFQSIARGQKWGVLAGGFIAAWLAVEVAALGVGLQLAVSNPSISPIAIPSMAGVHALIGIGEGLITVGALAFIRSTRPDLLQAGTQNQKGGPAIWVAGLLLAVMLALLAPWASRHPDGLNWVAAQQGFLDKAQAPLYQLIPRYLFPGIANRTLATILAGVIGTLIVFGTALGVAYARRRRHN